MADYNTGGKADDALLSDSDKRLISKLKAAYAKAATQTEKDSLHRQAEAIRAAYGYSGGTDGAQYVSVTQDNGSLPQTQDYSEYIARARTQESGAAVDELKRQKKRPLPRLMRKRRPLSPTTMTRAIRRRPAAPRRCETLTNMPRTEGSVPARRRRRY